MARMYKENSIEKEHHREEGACCCYLSKVMVQIINTQNFVHVFL